MKIKPTPKWAIKLRSRHTGEEIYLGSKYDSVEEAEKAAKQECLRCNSYSVYPTSEDSMYWGRHQPLRSQKDHRELYDS